MAAIRRVAHWIAGIGILASLAYGAWSFGRVEQRVRQACSEITPGMSVNELGVLAREKGLNPPHRHSGTVVLAERRSFGRWGCTVDLESGRVVRSAYSFAD